VVDTGIALTIEIGLGQGVATVAAPSLALKLAG